MIGIFDSGVGGLSVYREIRKLLPGEDYVYFADNANCPYGEKPVDFIIGRAREISGMLAGKGADIIVVACNTATAAAINTLRKELSDTEDPDVRERVMQLSGGKRDHIPFIGMEPAIKPAIALTRSGTVGVLATAGTLKAEKYRHTRDVTHGKVRVVEHIGEGFVELVERCELGGVHAENVVKASLQPLLDAGADTIVLGCTHYPFLMDVIKKIAGTGINIIDPAPAVAKHLTEVMQNEGIRTAESASGRTTLLASGDSTVLKRLAAQIKEEDGPKIL